MTATERLQRLKTCALCPNVCRRLFNRPGQDYETESATPSALAYLAYALAKGYVTGSRDVMQRLSERTAAERCVPACPFGFDIPGDIAEFLREAPESTGS